MSKRIYKGSLLATTIMAGLAMAMPAHAQSTQPTTPSQEPDTTDEGTTAGQGTGVQPQEAVPAAEGEGGEIVITGTLIRNPNLTSSSPVAVVGQEELNLRQTISVEQVIRDVPGVVPNVGNNVNNGQNGQARVDLRGLGAQRNIVMLDSTRLVPSNFFGTVDLNNIPVALIDRLDVLTGGASTTYGADAVTGVVNFITKKDFAGMDLRLTEQISERGDANTFRADLVLGANFDDGRGNATLAIGYIETDPVYFGDRPLGQCVVNSLTGFCGGDSPTSTPTSFNVPNLGNSLQIPPPGGTVLVNQYALYNFNPFNIYQTPFRRYNAYASAHYDVSDKISVYGRALFSKNITSSIIAPSGVFGESLTVPGYNPFLSAALRDQLCTAAGIALGTACNTNAAIPLGSVFRRTPEVGPRISEFTTNVFDFKAGFTYDITDSINFDLYGTYGESLNRQVQQNYVAKSRLQQSLNVNPANVTQCSNTANGCVPLNLFGQPGTITPEMAAFIGGIESSIVNTSSLAQVHGVISGDLGFALPWAAEPVAFAVGAEHRDYGASRQPDNLAQVPGELGGAGGAILPLRGGYTAEDFFGELIVPLIADKPGFQELTIEGGLRYSKYAIDTAGNPKFNATTWKLGATYQPMDALKFRGNLQKAVRAPNIGELFAPVVTGLTALSTDPCAGTLNSALVTGTRPLNPALSNPALVAVCLAQGAPASTIGLIEQPAAGQANATGGGNPLVGPETAKTFTVGVVVTPRDILPGFNASLDYYNIRVKDAITRPLPGDVIAACFGTNPATVAAAAATSPACTGIRRDPISGRLSGSPATTLGLPVPLSNAGELFTDGFDLTMNYRRDIGFADLTFNFAGNYTREAKFRANAATGEFGPNCAGQFSVNCGLAIGQLQPKYAWNQRTTLSFKHTDISLAWRHLSSFDYEAGAPNNLPPLGNACAGLPQPTQGANGCPITGTGPFVGDVVNFNHIPAYDYFDLTTRFSVTDNFELTLSAYNLFDKQPPLLGGNAGTASANSGNTFPSTYDVIGRRYSASVRLKF